MAEEEGVKEIHAGGDELKVVAIGHLAGDDSCSVACEEHLVIPGHDGGVGQDKFAEVAGGEREDRSNRESPANVCSKVCPALRLYLRRVVKAGRCWDKLAHGSARGVVSNFLNFDACSLLVGLSGCDKRIRVVTQK